MKISAQALKAFNEGKESKFNDNWNVANGLPTLQESFFLIQLEYHLFGCCGMTRKITQKDIKQFALDGLFKPSSIRKKIA